MSELNDPRVLFAAERTLLAWSRTASGLMALGFIIDRSELVLPAAAHSRLGMWIGLAFVAGGVLLSGLSVVQYRKSVAELRPVEIPAGYWLNLSVYTSAAIGVLGCLLAAYLVFH